MLDQFDLRSITRAAYKNSVYMVLPRLLSLKLGFLKLLFSELFYEPGPRLFKFHEDK